MRRFISSHLLDFGLVFVVLIWGISPTLFKIALEEVQPLTLVIIRFILLSAVSLGVLFFYARRHPTIHPFRIHRADMAPLIISGLSGYGIYQIFYIEGLFHTTAFAASLFSATVPLWSAVLLATLRVERIRAWQWVGIVVSLCGVVWFLLARAPATEPPVDHALTATSVVIGNVLLCCGAGLFALYGVVNKRLAVRYSPPELMCYTLLIGTLALIPFGVPALAAQDWSHVTWRLWAIIPYSVVFPIYITYSIWNWAIGKRGVGYVTLYNYATPVLGGVAAFLALGEELSLAQALAAVIVLGGMLLARWAITHRPAKRLPEQAPTPVADVAASDGLAREVAD